MPRMGIAQALIPSYTLLRVPQNRNFGDFLEGGWRRGCRVQCAKFGVRVREYSTEVHAAGTGDVFWKQASKNAHDAGLDKPCTL
jgi:hypothetical protein